MVNKTEKIIEEWWNTLDGSRELRLPSPRLCDINDVEKLIDALRGNDDE